MFTSSLKEVGELDFPNWSGTRIQMMPVMMSDPESIPANLGNWKDAFVRLCSFSKGAKGIGYLTIDERKVKAGEVHRRPGLHVDGMGVWGRGGGWGINGMLMSSNVEACVAWNQEFLGYPNKGTDVGDPREGDCEHLREQASDLFRLALRAGRVYWCEAMCVHESIPVKVDAFRTFVRLSMPSYSEWPVNCTPNPLGIKPAKIGTARRVDGEYKYASV